MDKEPARTVSLVCVKLLLDQGEGGESRLSQLQKHRRLTEAAVAETGRGARLEPYHHDGPHTEL